MDVNVVKRITFHTCIDLEPPFSRMQIPKYIKKIDTKNSTTEENIATQWSL